MLNPTSTPTKSTTGSSSSFSKRRRSYCNTPPTPSYQEEHQRLDQNEQIIQAYKNSLKRTSKDSSNQQSNKLPPIQSDEKPMAIQVPKSHLKKVNPNDIFNPKVKNNENEQFN